MNTKDLKVGDFAVNNALDSKLLIIDKKYPIIGISRDKFAIIGEDGDFYIIRLNTPGWTFEPNLFRLKTQSTIVEVTTNVLVTFEKTQIENGEEYLIKTIELADMPALRKEVEYQVHNLANPQADDIIIKWENQ